MIGRWDEELRAAEAIERQERVALLRAQTRGRYPLSVQVNVGTYRVDSALVAEAMLAHQGEIPLPDADQCDCNLLAANEAASTLRYLGQSNAVSTDGAHEFLHVACRNERLKWMAIGVIGAIVIAGATVVVCRYLGWTP